MYMIEMKKIYGCQIDYLFSQLTTWLHPNFIMLCTSVAADDPTARSGAARERAALAARAHHRPLHPHRSRYRRVVDTYALLVLYKYTPSAHTNTASA